MATKPNKKNAPSNLVKTFPVTVWPPYIITSVRRKNDCNDVNVMLVQIALQVNYCISIIFHVLYFNMHSFIIPFTILIFFKLGRKGA